MFNHYNLEEIHDRARAAFIGMAIGDALGATVEFMTSSEIREKYGIFRDIIGGGWLRLKPGQVTDDTEMALCIARAIAVNPEVILMDEPCSALDPISTLKIEELIEELKSKYTIVIVTHNMQQAARVSDVTAFFYLGELIEVGGTRKIFTNPEKKQTEDYITGRFG